MRHTGITMLGARQVRVAGREVELPAGQLRVVLASLGDHARAAEIESLLS